MAVDPVCGMYVDEATSTLKAVVGGRTYYFCSTTCMETFLEPEKGRKRLRLLVLFSFALGVPAFLLSLAMELHWTPDAWMLPLTVVVFLLATPVQVGHVVVVRPGERIPMDGEIAEGFGSIDESMITGESIPLDKAAGDPVIGATINRSGLLKVRATKIGKDTTLSQIIQLVEDAQVSRAPIQRIADRVAALFVPAVIAAATLAAAYWFVLGFPTWRPTLAGYGLHSPLTTALSVFVAATVTPWPRARAGRPPAAHPCASGKGGGGRGLTQDRAESWTA